VKPVLVEGLLPGTGEVIRDVRIRRQDLGGHDLDAGADAQLRHTVQQAVKVVPAGPELGAGRVQGEPKGERVLFGFRRGRRDRGGQGRRLRRLVRDGQFQCLVHEVGDVHSGSAVLSRGDLHVGQAELPDELDGVLPAQGHRGAPLGDQQGMFLEVPEGFALGRQVRKRVADAAQFQGQVIGRNVVPVNGEPKAGNGGEPQAPVPRQRQGQCEAFGVGAEA
jgi:hypothetical protein